MGLILIFILFIFSLFKQVNLDISSKVQPTRHLLQLITTYM